MKQFLRHWISDDKKRRSPRIRKPMRWAPWWPQLTAVQFPGSSAGAPRSRAATSWTGERTLSPGNQGDWNSQDKYDRGENYTGKKHGDLQGSRWGVGPVPASTEVWSGYQRQGKNRPRGLGNSTGAPEELERESVPIGKTGELPNSPGIGQNTKKGLASVLGNKWPRTKCCPGYT